VAVYDPEHNHIELAPLRPWIVWIRRLLGKPYLIHRVRTYGITETLPTVHGATVQGTKDRPAFKATDILRPTPIPADTRIGPARVHIEPDAVHPSVESGFVETPDRRGAVTQFQDELGAFHDE
jgi:hypothetical protein